MDATQFSATLRPVANGLAIDLTGDINGSSEALFTAAYGEALDQNPEAILLNFNQVGYINSTGIALIVGLLAAARKSGIRLLTYGLSDHYLQIFQITRLADFMTIVRDEASAVVLGG